MPETPAKHTPGEPVTAGEWLDVVLDPGYERLFEEIVGGDPLGFPAYTDALAAAREETGESESIVVAEGTVETRPVIAIASEFGFLGGSMGVAAGERIRAAFERAAAEGRPVIGLLASGGARMQEGMPALSQMPSTLLARDALAAAKQPFIAYLRHPTTGGVYASFAAAADLLWAQPEATIGFAGPRVAEAVTGDAIPEDSHTAESAEAAGLIDELLHPEGLRSRLAAVLGDLAERGRPASAPRPHVQAEQVRPWRAVEAARAPERPTGTDYIADIAPIQRYGADPTIVAGITVFAGCAVVAIAQDSHVNEGRPSPAAFRRARHAIEVAGRLGLPIVTFVDTPGADPSARSERQGIAHEISATFAALLAAPVPTVSVVVGEGGSGGALALGVCDRLLIQRDAIFSVIAPEGAAAILKREDVRQVAEELRLTSADLLDFGIADAVIGESHRAVEEAIAWALSDIGGAPDERRGQRWRSSGWR